MNFLWNAAKTLRDSFPFSSLFAAADSELPASVDVLISTGETRRRREQRIAQEQREIQERAERKEQRDKEEDFDFLVTVLMAQEDERLVRELSSNITDLRQVVGAAYDRALEDEIIAAEGLAGAQRNAIVLPDGRHVYFIRDGLSLYGEDGGRITDLHAIDEARSRQKRDSTSYEDYCARMRERDQADERVEHLRHTLTRLDEIQTRIGSGKLSSDELIKTQIEVQSTIDALPPQTRVEYDRIHAARSAGQGPSYRAADPVFTSVPPMRAEFFSAVHPPQQELQSNNHEADSDTVRLPAYRPAPDF